MCCTAVESGFPCAANGEATTAARTRVLRVRIGAPEWVSRGSNGRGGPNTTGVWRTGFRRGPVVRKWRSAGEKQGSGVRGQGSGVGGRGCKLAWFAIPLRHYSLTPDPRPLRGSDVSGRKDHPSFDLLQHLHDLRVVRPSQEPA